MVEISPSGGLQRPLLLAEKHDDGRVRGYAVYARSAVGVTILPRAEFDRRYRH